MIKIGMLGCLLILLSGTIASNEISGIWLMIMSVTYVSVVGIVIYFVARYIKQNDERYDNHIKSYEEHKEKEDEKHRAFMAKIQILDKNTALANQAIENIQNRSNGVLKDLLSNTNKMIELFEENKR